MTDEQIIKAMQCVIGNGVDCSECAYRKALPFPSCRRMCAKNALDLINRQQAEIERYKRVIRLLENDVQQAKSEAIKEFAERLKGYPIVENESKEKAYLFVEVRDIDNLVKKMTEVQE